MELKNNEQCPDCGRYANRGVSIDAVIVKDGKILLIKRGSEPYKDHWALPGGYVEWDESIEMAVRREIKEEINTEVVELRLIGVYSKPDRHPNQVINMAYLVTIEGEPMAGDDAKEIKWTSLTELPEELAFDHRQIINDGLTGLLVKTVDKNLIIC